MKPQSEHLSNAQIEQYGKRASGAGPETDDWVEQHLDDCPPCRSRMLDFQRTRFALLPNPKVNKASTPDCSSEDDLRNLAAGLYPDPKAAELKAHAATCDHCGPLLQEYIEDFSDESSPEEQAFLERLRSSSPKWQEKTARKMLSAGAEETTQSPRVKRVGVRRWVLGFSFVLLVAAGAAWLYPLLVLHKANLAVEAEYRKGRPMEYRVAGVPYGPYARELGSHEIAPIIVIPNPERTPLLTANADLLHGEINNAKSTLEKALNKDKSLSLLNNLAVAYAMEADAIRPTSEEAKKRQHEIYLYALAITGRVLSDNSSDATALFNRALILDRVGRRSEAPALLKQIEQVEQDIGWRQEAEAKLQLMR